VITSRAVSAVLVKITVSTPSTVATVK